MGKMFREIKQPGPEELQIFGFEQINSSTLIKGIEDALLSSPLPLEILIISRNDDKYQVYYLLDKYVKPMPKSKARIFTC